MEQHIKNARITVNGKELPIIDGKITYTVPDPEYTLADFNATLKRLREPTTITWNINPGQQQPTGPIVEGSIEPYE